MTIERVSARNFRIFEKLDLELGQFNVIVGANASGKSNLVSIFQFLRSIPALGLRDAVLAAGGDSFLHRTRVSGASARFSITCNQSIAPGSAVPTADRGPTGGRVRATYSFSLHFAQRSRLVRAGEDVLKLEFVGQSSQEKNAQPPSEGHHNPALLVAHRSGKVRIELTDALSVPPEIAALEPLFDVLAKTPISDSALLLESPLMQPLFAGPFQDLFSSSIFSINPESARHMNVDIGKPVLDTAGANLSLVIGRLLNTPAKRTRFVRLVRAVLPDIVDVRSERFGNMVVFKVREHASGSGYFAAEALSDGTLSTIALIVALFFEQKPLLIIEEPERNLHPLLLSRLIDLMKGVSSERQLIVTTHSPAFVEGAGLESLFFLSRTRSGSSRLSRPKDSAAVGAFLDEDIGLGTLFSQNLISP